MGRTLRERAADRKRQAARRIPPDRFRGRPESRTAREPTGASARRRPRKARPIGRAKAGAAERTPAAGIAELAPVAPSAVWIAQVGAANAERTPRNGRGGGFAG